MSCLSRPLLFVLLALGSTARAAEQADLPGWTLTFQDEFNSTALDTRKWMPRDPFERERNHELQAYVTNAFKVKDGVLSIIADKGEAFYDGKQRAYTSGMMNTRGKFSQQYGRFEIRCRVPRGKGLWPAFWLLPVAGGWPREIDVLEFLGQNTARVHMAHHFPHEKHGSHEGSWSGPDFAADFHQFAIEWSPQAIVWYVDGVERFRSEKSVPHEEMYLMVNLAVGGDWPGAPNEWTRFPAAFAVDYVRVYRRAE